MFEFRVVEKPKYVHRNENDRWSEETSSGKYVNTIKIQKYQLKILYKFM